MDQTEEPKIGPENRNRKGQWGKWKGKACKEEGCNEPVSCRGFCASHYGKWKRSTGHRPPSATNKRSLASAKLKHRYGITIDDYERKLAEQDGKCAICGLPAEAVDNPDHWGKTLCVDHDHETGETRGLLCNDCNLTVKRGNTIEVLESAVRYLRLHNRQGS